MSDVVIVSAARTPVGSFNGALSGLPAHELGKIAIQAAVERAGIAAADVQEVIMGQVLQAGAGQIPARQAAVKAGIPMNVPALTINKVCLSGLDAIALADQLIRAGEFDIVVAMTHDHGLIPVHRFHRMEARVLKHAERVHSNERVVVHDDGDRFG